METFFRRLDRRRAWCASFVLLLGILLTPQGAFAQDETGEDLVKVRLLADVEAIAPGEEFTVGLEFSMSPHWHIYWRNPGDSGLAPQVNWQLPPGFEVGEIMWPVPKLIEDSGLVTYGYEDRVILLMKVTPPAELKAGEKVTLKANIDWLVCKDICLPGEGKVELPLSVSASSKPNEASQQQLRLAKEKLPTRQSDWHANFNQGKGNPLIYLIPRSGKDPVYPSKVYFYADQPGEISPNAPQVLTKLNDEGTFILELKSDTAAKGFQELSGVLVADVPWAKDHADSDDPNAWAVTIKVAESASGAAAGSSSAATENTIMPQAEGVEAYLLSLGLGGWLLLAFIGGLILNIMPCVLPVLSLKVFSLVKHAKQSRRMALAHGLSYTGGVVLSFLILAGVLLALRAGGEQVGWAFQLQSPTFVTLLTALLFLFGLNLFGVFEIGASLVGADAKVSSRGDLIGSFFTGILAAVVGAPCIGPFLGAVTGLAVQLPTVTALLVFAVMGLGLASPFLLLAIFPQAQVFIPKPGAWMETFKQFMGFLLMAAVLFFLWVLSTLSGTGAMICVMIGLLIMSMGAWVYGRWNQLTYSRVIRVGAAFIAIALLLIGGGYAIDEAEAGYQDQMLVSELEKKKTTGEKSWAAWSPAAVEKALEEGRPVFVDFTASWCLICQVNKRTVLRTPPVEAAFAAADVVTLDADWTHRNKEITLELEKYGRSGVPLYLLYSPVKGTKPMILPQSLTQAGVVEAVDKLSK